MLKKFTSSLNEGQRKANRNESAIIKRGNRALVEELIEKVEMAESTHPTHSFRDIWRQVVARHNCLLRKNTYTPRYLFRMRNYPQATQDQIRDTLRVETTLKLSLSRTSEKDLKDINFLESILDWEEALDL